MKLETAANENPRKRPLPRPEEYPPPMAARSPDRSAIPQIPSSQMGNYPLPVPARSPERSTITQMPNPAMGSYGAPLTPRSPDRTSIGQIPQNPQPQMNYPTYNRDYTAYYGEAPKRQRTSIDPNAQALYDRDGRYNPNNMWNWGGEQRSRYM